MGLNVKGSGTIGGLFERYEFTGCEVHLVCKVGGWPCLNVVFIVLEWNGSLAY